MHKHTHMHIDTFRDMHRLTVKIEEQIHKKANKKRPFLEQNPTGAGKQCNSESQEGGGGDVTRHKIQNAIVEPPGLFLWWPRAPMLDGTMVHPSIPGPLGICSEIASVVGKTRRPVALRY